ncbi:hypothetical protein SETIT_2G140700v2, partial [Setaria italica]
SWENLFENLSFVWFISHGLLEVSYPYKGVKIHPRGKETQLQPIREEHTDPWAHIRGAHQEASQTKGGVRGGARGSAEPPATSRSFHPLMPSLHVAAPDGFLMAVMTALPGVTSSGPRILLGGTRHLHTTNRGHLSLSQHTTQEKN